MRYVFICNPTAGSGAARRALQPLRRMLKDRGVVYEQLVTEEPGHAAELARTYAGDDVVVVAMGGDGTVQEVVQGVVESGREGPIGLLPLGTGNDVAHILRIPRRLAEAVEVVLTGEEAGVDCGRVVCQTDHGEDTRVFINAVGMGFDAHAAGVAQRMKRLPGSSAAYLAGVMHTLVTWTSPRVEVVIGEDEVVFDEPLLLASVCNGRRVGGGFLLAPEASVVDGFLDLCTARSATRRRILRLLPKAFTPHLAQEPEVTLRQVRRVRVRAEAGLPVHVDGEVLGQTVYQMDVQVMPRCVRVRVPRKEE